MNQNSADNNLQRAFSEDELKKIDVPKIREASMALKDYDEQTADVIFRMNFPFYDKILFTYIEIFLN